MHTQQQAASGVYGLYRANIITCGLNLFIRGPYLDMYSVRTSFIPYQLTGN